ncbi:MAG: Trm112 family protein [Myxococcota bacterium]
MVDRDGAPLNPVLPILKWVVCPACRQQHPDAELSFEPFGGEPGLRCSGCARWYPVVDGVPYLVEEYSRSAAQ